MFIEVKHQITVRCENVGAIFMAEITSSGVRTQHVDSRHHCVCEHIVGDSIKTVFVKSCEKDADMFSKKCLHKTRK
jgi:hypothetical protein